MCGVAVGAAARPVRRDDLALPFTGQHAVQLVDEMTALERGEVLDKVRAVGTLNGAIIEGPVVLSDVEDMVDTVELILIEADVVFLFAWATAQIDKQLGFFF